LVFRAALVFRAPFFFEVFFFELFFAFMSPSCAGG